MAPRRSLHHVRLFNPVRRTPQIAHDLISVTLTISSPTIVPTIFPRRNQVMRVVTVITYQCPPIPRRYRTTSYARLRLHQHLLRVQTKQDLSVHPSPQPASMKCCIFLPAVPRYCRLSVPVCHASRRGKAFVLSALFQSMAGGFLVSVPP
jgi:hypothetical protein